jgi:hypothetical protein
VDRNHEHRVRLAAEEFLRFTDKYVDNVMLCDHPALGYMLEHLKATVRGPEQLEFPFVANLKPRLAGV